MSTVKNSHWPSVPENKMKGFIIRPDQYAEDVNLSGMLKRSLKSLISLMKPGIAILFDSRKLQFLMFFSAALRFEFVRNPRNKCALQPGHSLIDWIRLGKSGRDLTGVGARAGTLSVSPRQLAEHGDVSDAWIAIRGKVYNVTAYLPFHPGGPDELMRGAGKDATALFNEIHAWVNYESILQQCLVGRLTAVEPDIDTEALFYGTDVPRTPSKDKQTAARNAKKNTLNITNGSANTSPVGEIRNTNPRFDWIQKTDYITTIFYTKPFSNPQVQVSTPTKQNEVDINLTYEGLVYTNHLHFTSNIHWPCKVTINYETGKVEVTLRKIVPKIWDNYGVLKQTCNSVSIMCDTKVKYIVVNKMTVNHNTCLLALQRSDGVKQTIPLGKHVRVYGEWNGQEISRSYTPVPSLFMQQFQEEPYGGDVCLMVKGYPQGMLSPYICNRSKGDIVELSRPLGSFDLRAVENKEAFLLLAAGTGITPMLSLVLFILDRRTRRCQRVTLMFFNRKEEDILCREQLDKLQKADKRLTVEHVLSEPSDRWTGDRGHVNKTLLKATLDSQCADTQLFPADVHVFVCGPTVFTNLAQSILSEMGYEKQHMHCFVEQHYSDIIIDGANNDNDYDLLLTNNLRLSPIPCLENSDQWNVVQLTIDTGSRRNQKLIDNSNRNMDQILGKMQERTDDLNYEMYTVDDNMASQMEVYIKQNVPDEISFDIIYRNGFCQLLQPKKSASVDHIATGIMLRVSWLTEKLSKSYFTEFYHIHLSKNYWQDFTIPRSLIGTCLTLLNCRKISFKAQSLFVLLMNTFSFTAKEVSLEWIVLDPYIGCWLLDPDHPPTTFQGVQSQLDTRPKYKVTACDVAVRSCDMLIQLSEATQRLQSRLEERDLWTIFMEMEMKIVSILSVMEYRGISTNVNVLKTFSKTLKDKSETVEMKAYKIAGRKFQLNSPVQVRMILYDELKLDTTNCIEIKQTATSGAKSTSEPMLQLLRKVHPLPGLVLEYRHLNKAKSTFVDAMLQHVTNGIIKSTWEQTAAATGRIASSNPNLQAVPKHPFPLVLFPDTGEPRREDTLRLRDAYTARPGYSLLAADFQHIELRVFAHLSRDQSITDALNEPGDIFLQMTKSWLGDKVRVITDAHREQTKKIVYATIYGAGPGKLADILSVPQDKATAVLRDFTNKFPSLREFSTSTIEQCRIQGYLTSLSGRCRLFPNINSGVYGLKAQSERQAVNFLIQGSAADICKAAMISTEEKLKHFDCNLLLQIHDELVWEIADTELHQVKSIVKHVMEDTNTMCGKLIKLSVPLPVSISIGKSWGNMT
ncbi:uncharacterized protein CBL_09744 [Carabus blaptoides fortunei]